MLTDSQEVGRERGYATKTRQIVITDKDQDGEIVGTHTIDKEEQVHVVRVTTRSYYRCSNCQAEWSEAYTNEYEG